MHQTCQIKSTADWTSPLCRFSSSHYDSSHIRCKLAFGCRCQRLFSTVKVGRPCMALLSYTGTLLRCQCHLLVRERKWDLLTLTSSSCVSDSDVSAVWWPAPPPLEARSRWSPSTTPSSIWTTWWEDWLFVLIWVDCELYVLKSLLEAESEFKGQLVASNLRSFSVIKAPVSQFIHTGLFLWDADIDRLVLLSCRSTCSSMTPLTVCGRTERWRPRAASWWSATCTSRSTTSA